MSTSSPKIIDSHLHVWANEAESASSFPYAPNQTPPESLVNQACTEALLDQMKLANVDGALIVQPINHGFDHAYVSAAIKKYPEKFKGMMLYDPSLDKHQALTKLKELHAKGFVGVRFNPYLWPEGCDMSADDGVGLAVYKQCGALKLPVGVMCFKGLHLHYDDIVRLVEACPETPLILDHFGFTALDSERGDASFEKLLSLSKYPSVHVKISALFRVCGNDASPYEILKQKRFDPLLEAYGAKRLLFGTDFPFVLEQSGGYKGTVDLVKSWLKEDSDRNALMGGNVERLFGSFS